MFPPYVDYLFDGEELENWSEKGTKRNDVLQSIADNVGKLLMVAEENKKAIEAINQRLDIMESKIPSYNHQNIINSLEHSPTPIIDSFTPNNERHGCTVICDDDASMIAMPKKKQKKNICVKYIKDELAKEYSREELAKGGYEASNKNYMGVAIISEALSPTRLKKVLVSAKRLFPGQYSTANVPNIVNEKCRKTRHYKVHK